MPTHARVWAEEGCTSRAPEAAEPFNPALLRLPIWTDAVLHSVNNQQLPTPDDTASGSGPGIQLPQSITWQRIPEPMTVTSLRLFFEGHAAADIQQGMVCGLTVAILGPGKAGGQQQDEVRKLRIAPASFVAQDQTTLCVNLEVPIGVDEWVSLTADGNECGPGDAVYLASWSGQSTRQSFMDDAMETAYVLSHGDAAAGDACLVEVLLHQAEDTGKPIHTFAFGNMAVYMHSSRVISQDNCVVFDAACFCCWESKCYIFQQCFGNSHCTPMF